MLMKGLKIYKYFNTNGSLSRTDVHILLLKMVMCISFIFFNVARRLLLECGPHTTKCCLQVYLLQRSTDKRQKFASCSFLQHFVSAVGSTLTLLSGQLWSWTQQ